MPARKREGKGRPESAKTFRVGRRTVQVRERADGAEVRIDGETIALQRLATGEYHTHFLPFQGFPTAEAAARVLAAHADQTFKLGAEAPRGGQGRGRRPDHGHS